MKTICLLLAIAGVVLVAAEVYAAPSHQATDQAASESAPKAVSAQSNRSSSDSGPQSDARESGEHHGLARSAKPRPRPKGVASKPRRPRPPARQRSVAEGANPPNVRPSAPVQSAAVVNRGSVQNEAIYRALPVRSGSAIRPGTAAGGNLRHRDPNPPVIGGAASSSNRNTAAIDGTRTNLKRSRN